MVNAFPSLCQSCCMTTHPTMLSGYCINGHCERCGKYDRLAMTKAQPRPLVDLLSLAARAIDNFSKGM